MRKKMVPFGLAILATAGLAAAQDSCPITAGQGNEIETTPLAMETIADAYGAGNAHFAVGTSDPNGPPFTISAPACGAGTTIGRAAYVGSFSSALGGYDMAAVFVFDATQLVASANKHALRFRSIQNFVGNGYALSVKILENRGDAVGSPGARGLFNRAPVAGGTNTTQNGGLGPFGSNPANVRSTILADAHDDRGNNSSGSCAVAGGGTFNLHDSGGAGQYATFDRDVEIALVSGHEDNGYSAIKAAIVGAQSSATDYYTCKYSCLTPAGGILPQGRNVDCGPGSTGNQAGPGIHITHPIYVAVTALAAGTADAARRLQDSLAVDNIIHLFGDSDFCGEATAGDTCRVTFVSKL